MRLRFEFSTSQTQVCYFKDTTNYSAKGLAEIFQNNITSRQHNYWPNSERMLLNYYSEFAMPI